MKSEIKNRALFLLVGLAFGFLIAKVLERFDEIRPDQFDSLPPVSTKAYSKEALDHCLANGKDVIVVVRSDYSIWSNKFLDTENVRKLLQDGALQIFELVWSWESTSEDADAIHFFEKFGYSKEAIIVVYRNKNDAETLVDIDHLKTYADSMTADR